MNTIRLKKTLPHVFKQRTNMSSEIWLQDICFEKGKTYLIEAASGTGKSSMCSYILGYRNDYYGQIMFDETDISQLRISDWVSIRKNSISHLFQELRLFPELTALENVEIKNKLTKKASSKQITDWFARLGISDKLHSKLGIMSFGQQQRVAMIRALVQPFDFILLDEPISHLDPDNSRIMGEIMTEEAQEQGAGIIITSIGKHMDLNYDKIYKL